MLRRPFRGGCILDVVHDLLHKLLAVGVEALELRIVFDAAPDNVKAEAVEAARPAAELMNQATTPRTGDAQPSMQNTPDNTQTRGRSLSMER